MENQKLKWFVVAVFFGLFVVPPGAGAKGKSLNSSDLWGKWRYTEIIYKGDRLPPLDPTLIMTFEFTDSGLSDLHYRREGDEGFCHRSALWFLESPQQTLYQKVTWLDPNNRGDCGRDPDMRMDQEAWTPVRIENDKLLMSLPLGDEEIILVWKKLPE